MPSIARRSLLNVLGLGSALLTLPRRLQAQDASPEVAMVKEGLVDWTDTNDRVFLSGDCWANPMEDWKVADGTAECIKIASSSQVAGKRLPLRY